MCWPKPCAGAGDAFASAFVSFSRLWGDSGSDALEKAHCAAAIKIQVQVAVLNASSSPILIRDSIVTIKYKGGANGHPTKGTIEAEWSRRRAAGEWS
jgi:hypothetical protein